MLDKTFIHVGFVFIVFKFVSIIMVRSFMHDSKKEQKRGVGQGFHVPWNPWLAGFCRGIRVWTLFVVLVSWFGPCICGRLEVLLSEVSILSNRGSDPDPRPT